MEKLLPCPFCGIKPKFLEGWGAPAGLGTAWQASITCKGFRCAVQPQLTAHVRSIAEKEKLRTQIATAWNKRFKPYENAGSVRKRQPVTAGKRKG